jgi:hypothetical protein
MCDKAKSHLLDGGQSLFELLPHVFSDIFDFAARAVYGPRHLQ